MYNRGINKQFNERISSFKECLKEMGPDNEEQGQQLTGNALCGTPPPVGTEASLSSDLQRGLQIFTMYSCTWMKIAAAYN